jgi:large repetitive protein
VFKKIAYAAFVFLCFSTLQLVSSTIANATAPIAGTTINNKAQIDYFDSNAGFFSTLFSNTVKLTIQPVEKVLVQFPQTIYRSPGSFAALSYSVINTGNVTTTYVLTFNNLAGDNYDLTGLVLTKNPNGNGIPDPNEPPIANGGTVTLTPGQSLDFVLQGVVGASVPLAQNSLVNFTATSTLQSATQTVTDTVTTAFGASMLLSKKVSLLSAKPNDTLTYTLTLTNTGTSTATGIAATVDGVTGSWLVMRDIIPSNAAFKSLAASGLATPLYHQIGNPLHVYSTLPPADLTKVDAVGFGFSAINAGQNVTRSFDVRIKANTSGDVFNTAQTFYNDGINVANATIDSNQTKTIVPLVPPTINFYSNNTYYKAINVATTSTPFLYLEASASQCNIDPLSVETYTVILKAALTGDIESNFIITETGPNTGIFVINNGVPLTSNPVQFQVNNGVLSVVKNDKVSASMIGCGSSVINVNLLIDPFGVVYDGRSNVPIADAKVTLIDLSTGKPATVFNADGVTPAPNFVITGASGQYEFPIVGPGTYAFAVIPPTAYSFPSQLAFSILPANRNSDPNGSYGRSFIVNLASGPVNIDIPLDASALTGLFIEKTASRSTIEIGDYVDYKVLIKNTSGQILGQVFIFDNLPAGFTYVRNSVRINAGKQTLNTPPLPLIEPDGGIGPNLIFHLGAIPIATTITVTYRIKVGVAALQGNGINTAQATTTLNTAGNLGKLSNVSTATVKVLPGVFGDRGFILGKVFADCNQSKAQDKGERGVPGVRLYMEDGTNVITDSEGKFSYYNIRPQTHALKLDTTTLPQGATLEVLDFRNGKDAGSRFVDMKSGQLLKANFAISGCDAGLLEEIDNRVKLNKGFLEGQAAVNVLFRANSDIQSIDEKALPASGIVGNSLVNSPLTAMPASKVTSKISAPTSNEAVEKKTLQTEAKPVLDFESLLPTLDNSLSILSPTNKQVLGVAQTNVLIKGSTAGILKLRVNGFNVDASRVGKKSVLESTKTQAWEFIGVDLKPGLNILEADQLDSLGNTRGRVEIQVMVPGKFSHIKISVPKNSVAADGKTITKVGISITDADGVIVRARVPITLQLGIEGWQLQDLDKKEPGIQLFVENGELDMPIISPIEPTEVEILVSSGNIKGKGLIKFVPGLRPMIAVGVIEGAINLRKLGNTTLQPTRAQDGFEQELRRFSTTSADGKTSAGTRAALFLKGKVKGDYLLTLAYDSDKVQKDRLFRDIQPDEFYPVYGDDSVKGYDAQSTGALYVRVDRGSSYALYGDFTTQVHSRSGQTATQLSQYNRSLNGARGHFENKIVSANTFASRVASLRFTDEFPAKGVSGFYVLSKTDIIPNSEKIEILTRDRNQPAVIIKTEQLIRFSDYEIEPLTGRILFRAPIPSLDANFNLNSIRVDYEIEQGGAQFWVYGVDGQVQVTDKIEVGGTYVRDENPQEKFTLKGANLGIKLSKKTKLTAEVAQTDTSTSGTGSGARIELTHEGDDWQANVFVGKTDAKFDNPNALLNKGRGEAGAKASYRLNDKTRLKAEAIRSEDGVNNGYREGLLASVEHNFTPTLIGEAGVRYNKETTAAADNSTLGTANPGELATARFKLTGEVPNLPKLTVFGEYEQALEDSDKKMAALGGEYRLFDQTKLYAKHEFISSLGNQYTLNNFQQRNATVFGIDTEYMKESHLFSEYRMRDAVTGREAEAAIGLRNGWDLAQGVRLNTGFERIASVNGNTQESTAVTGAIEYSVNPLWKGTARLEYRTDGTSKNILNTLGLAYKLNNEWTLLGRNAISLQNLEAGGNKNEDRLQIGAAYRDFETNRFDGLGRYEFRYIKDNSGALDTQRIAHIVSTHINYQPKADLSFAGRYAGKFVIEDTNGISSRNSAHLLGARADYDFKHDWTIGVNTGTMFDGNFSSQQYALGGELGYLAMKNLWLSAGYNIFGFSDDELAGEDYTNQGFFLRMRFKFDESVLK